MCWSGMLQAQIVVFGCGNILFGDDGLAPRAVNALAEAQQGNGILPQVAFIDAGTSIRSLLLDMSLYPAQAKKIILVDVVQEAGRPAGNVRQENIGDSRADFADKIDPAGGFLHHAPTWGLLYKLHVTSSIEVVALTVQAAHIPAYMDDSLSPEAQAALPGLIRKIQQLCTLHTELEHS